MESSCEEDYFYDSESDEYDSENDDQISRKIFGGTKDNKVKIYCAICAGKHSEDKCPNKTFSKSY